MMRMLLITVCFAASTVSKGDEPEKESSLTAASYLHALALNANAFQKFDVLMQLENFHDIGPNRYFRDIHVVRIRLDRELKKMLLVRNIERRIFEPGDSSEKRRVLPLAAHYDGETLVVNRFQSGKQQLKCSLEEGLRYLTVADFRYVGFRPFPELHTTLTDFDEVLAMSQAVTDTSMSSLGNGKLAITHTVPFLNAPTDTRFTKWVFDSNSLMPDSYYYELRRTTDSKSQVFPMVRENYVWENIGGVNVPSEISGVSRHDTHDEDSVPYESDKNAEFHWFSLNKEIPEDDWSLEQVSSIQQALKLIDVDQIEAASAL